MGLNLFFLMVSTEVSYLLYSHVLVISPYGTRLKLSVPVAKESLYPTDLPYVVSSCTGTYTSDNSLLLISLFILGPFHYLG